MVVVFGMLGLGALCFIWGVLCVSKEEEENGTEQRGCAGSARRGSGR